MNSLNSNNKYFFKYSFFIFYYLVRLPFRKKIINAIFDLDEQKTIIFFAFIEEKCIFIA
jgi:hypothetical protein